MADAGNPMLSASGRLSSYPKVWNLGHPRVAEILHGPVEVQEKVDGSQFSFGVVDGVLRFRSKNAPIDPNNTEGLFGKAVAHILDHEGDLPNNTVFRGEAFRSAHHNHIAYAREPLGNIVLFDVMGGVEDYAGFGAVRKWAGQLGVECVRSFGQRAITGLDALTALLNEESILGGSKVEGVVLKNYSRWGSDGKAMMAKVVRADFREQQAVSWKKANPGPMDMLAAIGGGLATEARWRKSVQHLAEMGQREGSPRDIGALMKMVPADVREECEEEIKAALFKWAWPKLCRMTTRGLPEWYKSELVKAQFPEAGQ